MRLVLKVNDHFKFSKKSKSTGYGFFWLRCNPSLIFSSALLRTVLLLC